MSAGVPPWRRLSPRSAGARFAALVVVGGGLGFFLLVAALTLMAQIDDARARADRLDARAAALAAAADARRAEAGFAMPDAGLIAEATAWLDGVAPRRTPEAAMLDLVSSIRLIAQATNVRLASVAPLDGEGRGGAAVIFAAADMAGLHAAAAEARVIADHESIAEFLAALETADPVLRAAAIDIAARSGAATAEDERLTIRVVVGALSRAPES